MKKDDFTKSRRTVSVKARHTKKVTIDDLAGMITKSFSAVDKLASTVDELSGTVDNLAIMVAKGFDRVEERFAGLEKSIDKRFDAVDKRLDDVEESIATTNNNVLNLGDCAVFSSLRPRRESGDSEFDKLVTRVVRLERKTKV